MEADVNLVVPVVPVAPSSDATEKPIRRLSGVLVLGVPLV